MPRSHRSSISSLCLLITVLLTGMGCGEPEDTELSRSHAYMDSVRAMLGELRVVDHELSQVVAGQEGGVSASLIIPVIQQKMRPKVTQLIERAQKLPVTQTTAGAHETYTAYLETRLAAYELAIQGQTEGRQDLFEQFALKQIEAETLGRELETTLRQLRIEIPGYH